MGRILIRILRYLTKIVAIIKNNNNPTDRLININNEKKEKYYHLYMNYDAIESNNYFNKFINLRKNSKIKLIIDKEICSFKDLFNGLTYINYINFTHFIRSDIINMNNTFRNCLYLKFLNLSNFITDNVKDMSYMFYYCTSLEEINLSSFKTINVTNMSYMFSYCSSL